MLMHTKNIRSVTRKYPPKSVCFVFLFTIIFLNIQNQFRAYGPGDATAKILKKSIQ